MEEKNGAKSRSKEDEYWRHIWRKRWDRIFRKDIDKQKLYNKFHGEKEEQ